MTKFLQLKKVSQLKKETKRLRFLAGATDLFVLRSDGLLEGELFCDISFLDALRGIKIVKDSIHIGALTTFAEIITNKTLNKYASALVEAAATVGSPQIRNKATIGGNIANASPSGDSIPALYVLEAQVKTSLRQIPIHKLFKGPKKTILKKNELILEIIIPKELKKSAYYKIGARKSLAISKVSAAIAIKTKANKIDKIKIALGAVGPVVIQASKTEKFLKGKTITADLLEKASKMSQGEICPIDDFRCTCDYRTHTASVLIHRLLAYLTK